MSLLSKPSRFPRLLLCSVPAAACALAVLVLTAFPPSPVRGQDAGPNPCIDTGPTDCDCLEPKGKLTVNAIAPQDLVICKGETRTFTISGSASAGIKECTHTNSCTGAVTTTKDPQNPGPLSYAWAGGTPEPAHPAVNEPSYTAVFETLGVNDVECTVCVTQVPACFDPPACITRHAKVTVVDIARVATPCDANGDVSGQTVYVWRNKPLTLTAISTTPGVWPPGQPVWSWGGNNHAAGPTLAVSTATAGTTTYSVSNCTTTKDVTVVVFDMVATAGQQAVCKSSQMTITATITPPNLLEHCVRWQRSFNGGAWTDLPAGTGAAAATATLGGSDSAGCYSYQARLDPACAHFCPAESAWVPARDSQPNGGTDLDVVQITNLVVDKNPMGLSDRATVKATVVPSHRSIQFSLDNPAPGTPRPADAVITPNTGSSGGTYSATLASGNETGDVRVVVQDLAPGVGCPISGLVKIHCSACSAGNSWSTWGASTCPVSAGSGYIAIGSLDFGINLGLVGAAGRPAGELRLFAETLTSALRSPGALSYMFTHPEVERVADPATGFLRQIVTPRVFVDIVTLTPFKYDVRFYYPEQRGAPAEDGIYAVLAGAEVFSVWTVEDPDANPAMEPTRLQITQNIGGTVNVFTYTADPLNGTLSLSSAGLRTEQRQSAWNAAGDQETVTTTVTDPTRQNSLVSKTVEVRHLFAWGLMPVTRTEDPDGTALTTQLEYYTNPAEPGRCSRLKSVQNPDGSWDRYDYDVQGRKTEVLSPLGDITLAAATAANCRRTVNDFTPLDAADDGSLQPMSPRTRSEYVAGVLTGRTWYVYKRLNDEVITISEQAATQAAAFGDAGNPRTVTVAYPDDAPEALADKPKSVQHADGRLETYLYEPGVYVVAQDPAASAFTAGEGSDLRITLTHGTTAAPEGVPLKTTRETTVLDGSGVVQLREMLVCTATGFERIGWTAYQHDSFGRVTAEIRSDGTRTDTQWACCGKEYEANGAGQETSYVYDALKRLELSIRHGVGEDDAIITSYSYDAVGRQLGETRTGGDLSLGTSTLYRSDGRIQQQTDEAGLVTGYAYTNGGRTTTVTRPGGATQVTTQALDGRTASITSTGVTPQYYEYGVNADGTQWTKVHTGEIPQGGSFTDIPMWEKSITDFLGRTVRTEKPSFVGATVLVAESFYNTHGQLWKSTAPGTAPTLMEYNTLGEATRSGLDVNGNDTLDLASGDRIQEQETVYQKDAQNNWWRVSTSKTYPTADSATALVTGIQKQRLTGLGTAAPAPYSGVLTAESISIDVHSAQAVSRTYIDRDTKTVWQVTDVPTATNDTITQSVNGLMVSVTSVSSVVTYFLYDALGRQVGVTDPRISTFDSQAGAWQHINVTHYSALGQVDWTEDTAGNRTTYLYAVDTGQRTAVSDPLGQTTWTVYTLRGQVWRQWGATYPVEYEYDAHGRMLTLKTFRGGEDWFNAAWPADPGTADTTTWVYDPATGLLQQKLYADGKGPSYAYTTAGKLGTRTWARTVNNQPLVTTYSYSPATGEVTGVDYSDSTPDVSYTYTRTGQQATVTDACGTRSFEYSDSMELASETLPAYFGSRVITRQHDALGRDAGFTLGIVADPPVDPEYWVAYGYEAASGRFSQVSSSLFPAGTAVSYGYLANSDLLHTTSFPNGLVATKAYEAQRNLVDYVENKVGPTVVSKYEYTNDAAARRTARAQTGTAFAQPDTITWGYNGRNEVTSGVAQTDANYNFGYGYDPIGNRITASDNVGGALRAAAYSSNPLNQYSGITTNGTLFSPTHDADGNMTLMPGAGGTAWTLTWDGENRLVAAESANTRVEMAYDHMSRRVSKKVFTGTPGNWTLQGETRFVYDHWNLLAELDALSALPALPVQNCYVWGLDLSLSLQGAGGVGGLLCSSSSSPSSSMYFCYDANGNVSELLDATAAVQAHYEYDPFGGVTLAAGPGAAANTFRFSTKFTDAATGLVYYGYRYYAPEIGRWASRDPLQSSNLFLSYVFAQNGPCDKYDLFGLSVAFFNPASVTVLPNTPPLDSSAQGQFSPEHPEWYSIPHNCVELDSCWGLQLNGAPRGTIRVRVTLTAAQVPGSGVGTTPESGYEGITLLQHEWAHANIYMYLWNTAVLPMSMWFESQRYRCKVDCEKAHQALDNYLAAVRWTGALEGELFHDRVGQPRSSYYSNWQSWRTAAMNDYAATLAQVNFVP